MPSGKVNTVVKDFNNTMLCLFKKMQTEQNSLIQGTAQHHTEMTNEIDLSLGYIVSGASPKNADEIVSFFDDLVKFLDERIASHEAEHAEFEKKIAHIETLITKLYPADLEYHSSEALETEATSPLQLSAETYLRATESEKRLLDTNLETAKMLLGQSSDITHFSSLEPHPIMDVIETCNSVITTIETRLRGSMPNLGDAKPSDATLTDVELGTPCCTFATAAATPAPAPAPAPAPG